MAKSTKLVKAKFVKAKFVKATPETAPSKMIQLAVEKGADLEKLEKLLAGRRS